MITVALSTTIHAPARDVWRALVDPDERTSWDERILGEVHLARSGARLRSARARADRRTVRWRFKLGSIPVVLQDDPRKLERYERIESRLSIGSMQFDQTLTLYEESHEEDPHTRLGMKLVAHNQVAVIGEMIPRLDVQKIVIEFIDTTLRQIQKHCEA